jgi:hypothetical protein
MPPTRSVGLVCIALLQALAPAPLTAQDTLRVLRSAHVEEMYNLALHGRSDGGVFTVTPLK